MIFLAFILSVLAFIFSTIGVECKNGIYNIILFPQVKTDKPILFKKRKPFLNISTGGENE